MARNTFIPNKSAYYVPKLRGKAILPENWQPIQLNPEAVETITPAWFNQELSNSSLGSDTDKATNSNDLGHIKLVFKNLMI